MLQRSWREAVKSFHQPAPAVQAARGSSSVAQTTATAKRASFPSVLSVLQANALKQQVESFEQQRAHDEELGHNLLKRQPSLLRVLPANYNFQQAITEMSKSRSRVFWLLDLAAIVQAYVKCRKECKLAPGSAARLELAYRLHHNANPNLLRVLVGLGVTLQVSTRYDLQVCRKMLSSNSSTSALSRLYDDPRTVSKPNSYYRHLILDGDPDGAGTPLTVDGADEIVRIVHALTVMASRRQQKPPTLTFTLKVDVSADFASWQSAWDSTQAAAGENGGNLVGLALALPTETSSLDLLPGCLTKMIFMLEHIEEQYPKETTNQLQLYLSSPTSTLDDTVVDWLSHPVVSRVCQCVTLDVSHLLVAKASALCTRIIGVKENEPGKIHYYIDDGCYGSLSNVGTCKETECGTEICDSTASCGSSRNRPIPLRVPKNSVDLSDETEPALLSATVWGPTCDGLDKVGLFKLPKLGRDDWLVFPDIGFCNVGTAFNGFDPPDIAYCVMGSGGYYANTGPTTTK
jgi:hypothetical protein